MGAIHSRRAFAGRSVTDIPVPLGRASDHFDARYSVHDCLFWAGAMRFFIWASRNNR